MRVLLVDDTEDSRSVVRAMLERLGNDVLEASTGKEAIQVAAKENPDLVLMDLSMPEVDGFLATAALRTIRSFRQLPVIAITAYPKELSRDKALEAGCDGYLEKPLDLDALSALLKGFEKV